MTQDFDIDKLVDVAWICSATGYTPANITRKIRKGDIVPVFKRGRKYFFTPDVLDDLVCEIKFN